MQAFWQTHRTFLIRVVAGLAVFFILMNIAVSYRDDGRNEVSRLQNDLLGIAERLRELDGRHQQEQRNADALEERGEELLARLSVTRNAEVEPPDGGDPPTIDFPASKERRVWRAFTDRADRINLGYPQLRDISFDERSDLTDEEWADRYALLEVVRRVLDAGVEAQLDKFGAITPGSAQTEPVPEDPELALVRYPVSVQLTATYPELLSFVRSFQTDGNFLSIEIDDLEAGDAPGTVDASLTAVGVDLGPEREEGRVTPGRTGTWRNR